MPVKKAIRANKNASKGNEQALSYGPKKRKVCHFCEGKTEPAYTDSQALKKFLSDRARIVPKMRSGLCSKHQRRVSSQIKYARHLALLPFITRI